MTDLLTPGRVGEAEISFFEVSLAASKLATLRALASPNGEDPIPPGSYARLTVGGVLMMTDTPMEQRTNQEVIQYAHGHVLIAGLGLGMLLPPLLEKSEVKDVLVVEKSADVIALVGPSFEKHPRARDVHFLNDDIFSVEFEEEVSFETIYFDIWPDISTDNLEGMERLHRRFRWNLNPDDPEAWIGSWRYDDLREKLW